MDLLLWKSYESERNRGEVSALNPFEFKMHFLSLLILAVYVATAPTTERDVGKVQQLTKLEEHRPPPLEILSDEEDETFVFKDRLQVNSPLQLKNSLDEKGKISEVKEGRLQTVTQNFSKKVRISQGCGWLSCFRNPKVKGE